MIYTFPSSDSIGVIVVHETFKSIVSSSILGDEYANTD